MRVNPSRRTTFATVFREMITPSSWRSARIFGDPNTPSEAPWDQTAFCSNRSIRIARSDGFRASQAYDPGLDISSSVAIRLIVKLFFSTRINSNFRSRTSSALSSSVSSSTPAYAWTGKP